MLRKRFRSTTNTAASTVLGLLAGPLLSIASANAEEPPAATFPPADDPAPLASPVAPAPSATPPPAYHPAPSPSYQPYEPPPPPPPSKPPPRTDGGFALPPFSVRVDPFNWLLQGRLGIELEVGVWKFITLETVPVFVVDDSPPLFNLSGHEDNLYQHSNGLGALSGASLDVAFWLSGTPFRGYALRTGFTNYAMRYETLDDDGVVDSVNHTERQFFAMLGSNSRWGAFTLAGGIGLGYSLNRDSRCFEPGATSPADHSDRNCDDDLDIALDRDLESVSNLNGPLSPVELLVRFSLGVTID